MTKRFTVPVKYRFSHSKIQLNGEPLTNDELVRILNTNDGAFVENFTLKNEINKLKEEKEQLKQIIYEDESQIIGDWSSHIQEDMKELNEAYESDDINDLIRFCKEG